MAKTNPERIRVGEVAKRLGVSVHLVHQLWREGLLPPPVTGPHESWTYWHATDIAQAIATDVIGQRRRRIKRRPRPLDEEALARKYAIRRHFVEIEGRIRTAELAAAFGVDDGLQPAIDQLWSSRRRRT